MSCSFSSGSVGGGENTFAMGDTASFGAVGDDPNGF